MDIKRLSEIDPGERVRVVAVADSLVGERLQAVGFVVGTTVEVVRRAPLGDPTLYRLRGTQIALRRATAAEVGVRSAVDEQGASTW